MTNPDALFNRRFVALLLMQVAFSFALSVSFLLPKVLASVFSATAPAIGSVNAMFGVASVLVIPLIGMGLDRFGTRWSILAGSALLVVGTFGFIAVNEVGPLAFLLRGAHGVAWTIVFNAGLVHTSVVAPARRLAQAIGIYGSSNLLMNALAPAIAEPLMEQFGFRWVFAGAGAVGLGGFLMALRLEDAAPASARPNPRALIALMARPHCRRLLAVITLTGIVYAALFTFHQPFALEVGFQNVRGYFIGFTAGAVLVRVVFGGIADRWGHARVTILSLVLYVVAVAILGQLAPGRLMAFGALFGVAHGLFTPAFMAMAIAKTGVSERGQILTLMNGGFNGGYVLIPLVGLSAGEFGYPVTFALTALLVAVAAAITPRSQRQ